MELNYFFGQGVEADKEAAIKYIKEAADKDNVSAMYTYATLVYEGNVISANRQEAIKYFKN